MKQLKKDLQAVTKDLNRLIQKTDKLRLRLEKFEKAKTTRTVRKKTVAKGKPAKKRVGEKMIKVTAIDTILEIFNKSRNKNGIDVATLKKKTGFDEKKIWNVIYSLKKRNKVKGLRYGHYIKS